MIYLVCKIKKKDILQKGGKMNTIKKKPIRNLSLDDLYELAKIGYIFIKHENVILVGKE